MVAAHLMAFLPEQVAQPPAAGKGILHVPRIELTHQGHSGGSGGTPPVLDAASTQPKQPCLAADTQPVRTVDPRLALGKRPALLSAPSKQSFSRVSCPIFACNAVTSLSDTAAFFTPPSKTSGTACQPLLLPLLDLVRMHVELLGEFRHRLSPRMAASATLAFKAGLWFRRARLIMVPPRERQ